jgi:hypothetical protein
VLVDRPVDNADGVTTDPVSDGTLLAALLIDIARGGKRVPLGMGASPPFIGATRGVKPSPSLGGVVVPSTGVVGGEAAGWNARKMVAVSPAAMESLMMGAPVDVEREDAEESDDDGAGSAALSSLVQNSTWAPRSEPTSTSTCVVEMLRRPKLLTRRCPPALSRYVDWR